MDLLHTCPFLRLFGVHTFNIYIYIYHLESCGNAWNLNDPWLLNVVRLKNLQLAQTLDCMHPHHRQHQVRKPSISGLSVVSLLCHTKSVSWPTLKKITLGEDVPFWPCFFSWQLSQPAMTVMTGSIMSLLAWSESHFTKKKKRCYLVQGGKTMQNLSCCR